jgi:C-terminal processing protease CtpA/Prc
LDINNSGSEWIYPGKIVMLINEAPQSSGDDLPLKWKTACDAILIGSATSGTDAVMSNFSIPGNLTLYYSEYIGSFPNGKRVQRIGVQPDILVRPTIKGIQAGKDEVLERAVKYLQTGK